MFKKGSIIIVIGYPGDERISWVIVSRVLGSLKGFGWLLETEEGNLVLAQGTEGELYTRLYFLVHPVEQSVVLWLVRRGITMREVPAFTEYIKANFQLFLQSVGYFDGAVETSSPYKTDSTAWEIKPE